jgi:UDP-N-acetylmuramoyl-tripeptide--D-alanyl-D-alanine ligase
MASKQGQSAPNRELIRPNMTSTTTSFWTAAHLAAVTGGQWLGEAPDADLPVAGLSIDSRTIRPGQTYLAIPGERFDGHAFIADALTKGAAFAIASDTSTIENRASKILLVADPVAALQALAAAYREVLAANECCVIAVGGSNGKTTTRHLIHQLLTAGGLTGTQSLRSFNNHLGVPLTLLGASPDHDYVACEIGTNHPGEVASLAKIIRPDVAVVTCIGAEHLEFFGDLAGVEREEYALLDYLAPDGLSFTPRDELEPYGGELALPGEHNRSNAAYAEAVAMHLGVDEDRIAAALARATAPPGRLNVCRLSQDVILIDDTYNANPDSMRAALGVLAGQSAARRIAVLGDMFELGDASAEAHRSVRALADQVTDAAVFIGEHFGGQAWTDDLPTRIAAMINPGDAVLLKASRGMALERIIPAITDRYPEREDR